METWNLSKYHFSGILFSLDEEGSSNWRHIGETMEVVRDPGSQDRTYLEVCEGSSVVWRTCGFSN